MSNHQLNLFVALLLLAYPVLSIPTLLRSKKVTGRYFSSSKVLISKHQGNGNSFNMRNQVGFFITLLIGIAALYLYFSNN